MFTELAVTQLTPAPRAGGYLHIDDNYGLNEAIRSEMAKVIPQQEIVNLPSVRLAPSALYLSPIYPKPPFAVTQEIRSLILGLIGPLIAINLPEYV